MAWLSRLRGAAPDSVPITSIVATLVAIGVLVRIVAMFTDLDASGDSPRMLCSCGWWTQPISVEPGVSPILLVVAVVTFALVQLAYLAYW